MAESFLIPKVLTTAFQSLDISGQPTSWEFRNSVDNYSLNLQWTKESAEGQKSRKKRRRSSHTKFQTALTQSSKGEFSQDGDDKTAPPFDEYHGIGKRSSGAKELYTFTDRHATRKSESPNSYERGYKSYSMLDKVPKAADNLSFENEKEDLKARVEFSEISDKGFKMSLAKNYLEREERILGIDKIEDKRSTDELFKADEKFPFSAAVKYDNGSQISKENQVLKEETDDADTLKFKMNKFFEENDKVVDLMKKESDVEEPEPAKQWEGKASTVKSSLQSKYTPAQSIHEVERKSYEDQGHVLKGKTSEITRSEKSGFSYEQKRRSASFASHTEELLNKYEIEHERTQKLEELRKDYKQMQELRSSAGSFEAEPMKPQDGEKVLPGLNKTLNGVETPQNLNRHIIVYSAEYKNDPETNKTVTGETDTDLENIDRARKKTGRTYESVTSSSELSVSLSHIRYQRTQYKKRRNFPRANTHVDNSTTTENDYQTSSETSRVNEPQTKISSHESTRKRSSRDCCSKRAKCCCGQRFTKKEDAIRHVLSECRISVCFRVYLDIKVNRLIDRWEDEANRIMGREWWQMYKTGCLPDVVKRSPVLQEIQNLISEFIEKVSKEKFADKQGGEFIILEGIKNLPSKANGL